MRELKMIISFTMLLLLLPQSYIEVEAEGYIPGERYGDFEFLENDDGTMTITRFENYDFTVGDWERDLEEVVIPSSYKGKPVTTIGKYAFFGYKVERIVIPDTIKYIEEKAFANIDLSNVVIPDSVEIIGKNAFSGNNLKEIKIGKGVKTIGELAFAGNQFTTITIPAARPSDLTNEAIYHGKTISEWINGYNINEDGIVINHGFIHPDYMEFIVFNNTAAITATLANQPTPKAAFFNSDIVYKAFVDLPFESPPYDEPGGTIYIKDYSDIYYPQGNDWGYGRRMNFATIDAFADAFGYDKTASKPGSYWEDLHAQVVLDMQNRHEDGRTYSDNLEDRYRGKEECIAHHAAWAWLAKYVVNSGKLEFTNNSVEPEFQRLAGASRFHTAVEISKQGWENADTVMIVRADQFPDALTGVLLAVQKEEPILLTHPNELPDVTKNEIKRLCAKEAIILGE